MPSASPAHQSALEAVASYQVPNPGLLRISGPTHREYLQRQTSNDLGLLGPQQAVASLLTSAQGRVLEHFMLLPDHEDLLMLTQPGHGPGLAAYFQKRIFFNDQVNFEDQSAAYAQLELHGPQAAARLSELGLQPAAAWEGVQAADWQGNTLWLLSLPGYTSPLRYTLILPQTALPALLASLSAPALTLAEREHLRIQAGQPGNPEFNHQYTPFELGLERLVSATKGCYTGQEVLARQVTYDKVTRGLARVHSAAALSVGLRLSADGKAAGEVTSVSQSAAAPTQALAVLRRPHNQPGSQLQLENGEFVTVLPENQASF